MSQKPDRILIHYIGFVVVSFGLFIAWAGFVPLAEGVAAPGSVIVESDTQVVQHLEGGIIESILVKDGDWVSSGDPLVMLQNKSSSSSRDQLEFEHALLSATVDRLNALLDGSTELNLENDEIYLLEQEVLDEIDAQQTQLFREQKDALKAEISVLRQRKQTAEEKAALKQKEIESIESSRDIVVEELELANTLLAQQMGRVDRVKQLERERAQLGSKIAELETQIALANSEAADFSEQIIKARSLKETEFSTELVTASRELEEVTAKRAAAQDIVDRYTVYAPRSGEVLNMAFQTIGGVIRPGEEIMEIVPLETGLQASVQVRPVDRAQVLEGLRVRTTITAYRGWRAQPISGTIINISADLKEDPTTGASFYEAIIQLDPEAVAQIDLLDVIPGMPVQAFIYSGRQRTTLDYLFSPVLESVFKGMRTQ